jgi:rfaE bifunctional protein kinase chain/domain
MIDSYLWGKIQRFSPEANVPIVDIDATEHRLGGAANVALNIKQLGAKVDLMSIIGRDPLADIFIEQLASTGISTEYLIMMEDRKTTQKTRIYDEQRYVLRYDHEINTDILPEDENALLRLFEQYLQKNKPDVVLFQDYNKGMLTARLIQQALELCRKASIKTAIDPKRKNFFEYTKVSLFKPNLKEVKEALNLEINTMEDIAHAAVLLKKHLQAEKILITLSDKGAVLYEETFEQVAAHPRHIVDVSGAGDTVIAVAALCLANGFDNQKLLAYSNLAGGMVCEKAGVYCLSFKDLQQEISRLSL